MVQERSPSNPKIYKNRGNMHLQMGNLDLAIADFRTVLRINPQDSENLMFLNQMLIKSGRLNDLIECENILRVEYRIYELFYYNHIDICLPTGARELGNLTDKFLWHGKFGEGLSTGDKGLVCCYKEYK